MNNSRANYMKERRKGKKSFNVLIDEEKLEQLELNLQSKNISKKEWLEKLIDKELMFTNNIKEEWKDIKGYENLYQVSNLGRIKNLKTNKTLKALIKKDGYARVNLYKNDEMNSIRIHRIVAETFIENPYNYKVINHKDENKQNNSVENLEWCNIEYNLQYSKNKPVLQYDLKGNFIKEWNSIIEAKREVGDIKISECCKGKRKSAGGFVWRYSE